MIARNETYVRRTAKHQLEYPQQCLQAVPAIVEQIPEQDDPRGPVPLAL